MPATTHANVNDALRAMAVGVTSVLVHRGDATGDIPHSVAAMVINAAIGALVIDGMAGSKSTGGKGKELIADPMVDNFRIAPDRVAYVDLRGGSIPSAPGRKSVSGRAFALLKLGDATREVREKLTGTPGALASITAQFAGPAPTDTMLSDTDERLVSFWLGCGATEYKHTVVLWGRKPGPEGMYPMLKQSLKGLQQLVDGLCPERQVIIAGDYDIPGEGDPLEAIHKAIVAKGAIVIGRYWKADTAFWTRDRQIRLFHILDFALREQGKKMVHVGMRSGGLDMFALAGQRTIYMIRKNMQDARITPLATTLSGVDGGYMKKLEVGTLPTESSSASTGFGLTDLADILNAVRTAHSET